MEIIYQEVLFDKYCPTCKHYKKDGAKDPCNDCLTEPYNEYSEKPVYWEEK